MNLKMSEKRKEQLSALVDGELLSDIEPAVDEMLKTAELKDSWARYHLIRDTLKQSVPPQLDFSFGQSVSASIASEPTILAPTVPTNTLLKTIAGFAIAASVAAMAILGIQQNQGDVSSEEQTIVSLQPQTMTDSAPLRTVSLSDSGTSSDRELEAESRARLNNYMLNYNEHRSQSGLQGVLPHVRTVTFESNR